MAHSGCDIRFEEPATSEYVGHQTLFIWLLGSLRRGLLRLPAESLFFVAQALHILRPAPSTTDGLLFLLSAPDVMS